MAVLITLLEQHLDRQPPTVVTQATTWLETVLVLVMIQEIGLKVHQPVKVRSGSEPACQGMLLKHSLTLFI